MVPLWCSFLTAPSHCRDTTLSVPAKQVGCWPFLGAFPTTETLGKQAAQHQNVQKAEEPQAPNDMTAWPLTIMRNGYHGICRNWRAVETSERLKYASPCETSPKILLRLHDFAFSLQLIGLVLLISKLHWQPQQDVNPIPFSGKLIR